MAQINDLLVLGNSNLLGKVVNDITLSAGKQIIREQASGEWWKGRKNAILINGVSTPTSYAPIWSAKSINGSWDCGTYGSSNELYFNYITDTNYNAGSNTVTAKMYIDQNGKLTATTFSGAFSGNGQNITNLDAGKIASGTLAIARGGTGAATATAALTNLGALPLAGGTMTGQLKTSFKSSVAMGSYASSQTTIPNLMDELRYSSGAMGSVSIGTAYAYGNVNIPASWYNFFYSPHRTGGTNGSANGDNTSYGTLLLCCMTNDYGMYRIRYHSGEIKQVTKLYDTGTGLTKTYTATIPTSGWTANGSYQKITLTCSGILASDTPTIGPVQSSTTDLSILNNWSLVYRIDTAANQLIVYATSVPTTAVPIQIQCYR